MDLFSIILKIMLDGYLDFDYTELTEANNPNNPRRNTMNIYTNALTTAAKTKLTEWLVLVSKDELSPANISSYIDSVDFPNEFSAGHIEVSKYATKSGNPEVYDFDYPDFEDVCQY